MEKKRGIRKKKKPDIAGILDKKRNEEGQVNVKPEARRSKETTRVHQVLEENSDESPAQGEEQNFLSSKFLKSWKSSLTEF